MNGDLSSVVSALHDIKSELHAPFRDMDDDRRHHQLLDTNLELLKVNREMAKWTMVLAIATALMALGTFILAFLTAKSQYII